MGIYRQHTQNTLDFTQDRVQVTRTGVDALQARTGVELPARSVAHLTTLCLLSTDQSHPLSGRDRIETVKQAHESSNHINEPRPGSSNREPAGL